MGVLRALAGLVGVGLFGQVVLAVGAPAIDAAHGLNRLVRDAGGVGTDVRDQTLRALAGQLHAFVELLGDLHGFLGGEAQLARGLLLEVGGGKGRSGDTCGAPNA